MPPTLVIEMPSTEYCDCDGSAPWIEKLLPLSACTPGSVAIRMYGLVLPVAREFVGRLRIRSAPIAEAMVCVSVAIAPALVTDTASDTVPTRSAASTRSVWRAVRTTSLVVNGSKPWATTSTR